MIIAEQHLEFKLRANKINSNHYQDLKPYQIDRFLHDAALFISNHYGELFEFQKTQYNKDLFGTLLVKYPDQDEITPIANTDESYIYNLNQLKYEYLHLDRAYIKCDKNIIPITLIQHDKQDIFNDAYQKPSFKWKRLPAIIGKWENEAALYIYSDVDLNNHKLRLEYVKYPKEVFFGEYDSISYLDCVRRNGSNCQQYYSASDNPVNSDLPKSYHSLQVDVAVWLAMGKTENAFLINFISNKLQSLPK